jgi:hypothetical protein
VSTLSPHFLFIAALGERTALRREAVEESWVKIMGSAEEICDDAQGLGAASWRL